MRLEHVRRLSFHVPDSVGNLLYAAGFFAAYAGADIATRALARFDTESVGSSLLAAALGSNLPVAAGALVLMALVVHRGRARIMAGWLELEHGRELRWLALPCLFLMTWQGSLYQYNYVLDRAHLGDRLLVVALAAAALSRPIFLIPFVLQVRVIAYQFRLPFGTSAGQNIDDLLLIVLLALACALVVYAVTGRHDSAPVMLVITAAVAASFFIPGRGKVLLNWLVHEDLANIASSGYAAGWLGQTGGDVARAASGLASVLGVPVRVAVVAFELAAGIVVASHRWFRWWLPATIAFHIVNFVLLGFWFLTWVVLEISLLVVLNRRSLRPWLDRNLSLGRAALTGFAVVILGPTLFHPAGLAWLDSPVAYGLQVEAVGESGRRYRVPLDSFAPFNQELTFTRLQVGLARPVTGSYGVIVSTDRLEMLNDLEDVAEVAELEVDYRADEVSGHQRTERFLLQFVHHANRRVSGDNRVAETLASVKPMAKFWTGAPAPTYDFQEPIRQLEIHRLTSLRIEDEDGNQEFQHTRIPVLTVDQR